MRRNRWSIASLMWIVAFVAVWLLAARDWGSKASRLEEELLWLDVFGLLLLSAAIPAAWIWFSLVPRWSLKLAGGDHDRQSRLLRWVVETPFTIRAKARARFLLAVNDQIAGRYEEAEGGFRSILRDSRDGMDLSADFESLVRQHVADALEASGRPEEAEAERKQAAATLADEGEYFTDDPGRSPAPAEGKREPPSHLLRWVADGPFPGSVTLHARYLLAVSDQIAGRYDEAEASLRTVLRERDDGMALSPGFESELRRRLADSVEARGRPEEAEAERKRAVAALEGGRASDMPGIT
jgi:tetratricopeptide (TPR) repeat protein